MPAAPAFYTWKPPDKSVSVHFDLDVIEKLRNAVLRARYSEPERRSEVGGFLLGRVEPDQNIIVDGFELLHSEHKRGASFILSPRDAEKLDTRLQWWSKHHEKREPIGFFRSHTRTGLYLDRNDGQVISRFFSKPSDIALLVRPSADGTCTAGCFFPENGEMQGAQTYLEFPFEGARLAAEPDGAALLRQPEPAVVLPFVNQRRAPVEIAAALLALLLLPLLGLYAYRATSLRPQMSPGRDKPGSLSKVSATSGSAVHTSAEVNDNVDGLPVIEERVKMSANNQRDWQSAAALPLTAARTHSSFADVQRTLNRELPNTTPVLPAPPPLEGKSTVHLSIAPPLPPASKAAVERAPSATVTLEPVNESMVRRAVNRVPLVSVLQRHRFKAGDRFTPARPVRDVAPIVPRELRSKISGAAPIDLKITIDKTGSVAETELLSKKADSALAELAVRTASRWDFTPARINSRPVTSEMLVHMRFGEHGATVIPGASTVSRR